MGVLFAIDLGLARQLVARGCYNSTSSPAAGHRRQMMAKGYGDGSIMRVLEVTRVGSGSVWRAEEVFPRETLEAALGAPQRATNWRLSLGCSASSPQATRTSRIGSCGRRRQYRTSMEGMNRGLMPVLRSFAYVGKSLPIGNTRARAAK